jgi:hypothetical protein
MSVIRPLIDTVDHLNHLFTIYRLSKEFGLSADDVYIQTRIKNPEEEGGMHCYNFRITLICEKGVFLTNLVQEGCNEWAGIKINNTWINGLKDNLDKMTIDMSEWHVLEVVNNEKKLIIEIDNETVYTMKHQEEMGTIKVVEFMFRGTESVDYLRMWKYSTDQLVYIEKFE